MHNSRKYYFHYLWLLGFLWRTQKWCSAAAKSRQSCLTLCDPIDGSPTGFSVPGMLQARTLEWVAISFSNAWKWKVKVKSLSHVPLLVTPWTAAYRAPPSVGFSGQEYWSGVPLPSPVLVLINIISTWATWAVPFRLLITFPGAKQSHVFSSFQRAQHLLGFPCGSAGKESACNAGDLGWEDRLEKGKATHFSVLAWRIPRTV